MITLKMNSRAISLLITVRMFVPGKRIYKWSINLARKTKIRLKRFFELCDITDILMSDYRRA
jgi:hypothetical protein